MKRARINKVSLNYLGNESMVEKKKYITNLYTEALSKVILKQFSKEEIKSCIKSMKNSY